MMDKITFDMDGAIKGIFLLILAVSGNFVAETMGCKTQQLLTENMFVKHVVLYLIIFFALGFTSEDNALPSKIAREALIVWMFFVMFTRMSLFFTMIVFLLLAFRYVINTYIEHYKQKSEKKNKKLIENLKNKGEIVVYVILLTLILGFSLYFRKQYNDWALKHKKWSTFKFIFGVRECKLHH